MSINFCLRKSLFPETVGDFIQTSASVDIIIFRYNRVKDESVNVSVCGVRYDQKFCKEISYVTFILHDHWFKLRNSMCHSKSVCDIRFDCLLA